MFAFISVTIPFLSSIGFSILASSFFSIFELLILLFKGLEFLSFTFDLFM